MTNSTKKKNVYKHPIDLQKITIKNAPPREFATLIERIPYQFNFSTGELPEALIKASKWIWGLEDVNYPNGKGRALSWEAYESLLKELIKNEQNKS